MCAMAFKPFPIYRSSSFFANKKNIFKNKGFTVKSYIPKARYIAFLDSDDFWDSEFLERLIKFSMPAVYSSNVFTSGGKEEILG